MLTDRHRCGAPIHPFWPDATVAGPVQHGGRNRRSSFGIITDGTDCVGRRREQPTPERSQHLLDRGADGRDDVTSTRRPGTCSDRD
jgi:hypothetical protein